MCFEVHASTGALPLRQHEFTLRAPSLKTDLNLHGVVEISSKVCRFSVLNVGLIFAKRSEVNYKKDSYNLTAQIPAISVQTGLLERGLCSSIHQSVRQFLHFRQHFLPPSLHKLKWKAEISRLRCSFEGNQDPPSPLW